MTLLYRAGVDPLKAMKIVGHSEYQTTADIGSQNGSQNFRGKVANYDGVSSIIIVLVQV